MDYKEYVFRNKINTINIILINQENNKKDSNKIVGKWKGIDYLLNIKLINFILNFGKNKYNYHKIRLKLVKKMINY